MQKVLDVAFLCGAVGIVVSIGWLVLKGLLVATPGLLVCLVGSVVLTLLALVLGMWRMGL
jgi:hypothetical protein